MINTQENQVTKIYLVSNCYGDPNKVYIGKERYPKKDNRTRYYNHRITYGVQIKFEYIDEIQSLDCKVWKDVETKWIQYYIDNGYDVQNKKKKGGSGVAFCTEEHKKRIGDANRGKPKPEGFGEKIKNNLIGHECYQNPERGRKISETNTGRKQSKEAGLKKSKAQKGKPKPEGFGEKLSKIFRIPILQYDKQGNFIKEWGGSVHAKKALNINSSDITQCCREKKKSAGGFIWKYKFPKVL